MKFPLPEQFPTDFSAIQDAALASWRDQIRDLAGELSVDNDEDLDQLEAYAGQIEALEAEIGERAAAAAANDERKARIQGALQATTDTPQDTLADDSEDEDGDDADDSSSDDADGNDDEDDAASASDASDDEAALSMDKADNDAVDQLADSINDGTDVPETTLQENRTASQRAAGMQNQAPADRSVKPAGGPAGTNESPMLATKHLPGVDTGQHVTFEDLAKGASEAHWNLSKIRSSEDSISLVSSSIDDSNIPSLGQDQFENFTTLTEITREATEAHMGSNGMIASGAPCMPTKVDYGFFRLSRAQRPVEQNLPRVAAPQASIRFVAPPDWAYLSQGISIKTCADEAVDPYVNKSVVSVICPALRECCVSSVSRILQFNNLTFRAFKSFTAEAIYQLGVAFTEAKEIMYLDDIDAESTAVTNPGAVYGANRDLYSRINAAAYGYRKRHRMSMDAPLTFMVNDIVQYLSLTDAFNDGRMSFGRDPHGALREALSKIHVNIVFTYHLPTSATQAQGGGTAPGNAAVDGIFGPQAAGALNALPTEVAGYLFAPGTFIRLDGGSLDLGLVRDSVLNVRNDLHLFAEQWTKVCKVGYESVKLLVATCPNGAGSGDLAAFNCP